MDRIIHGALAIIYGLLTVGMFVFASRLGAWRFPVLLGLVSFSCALVLILLAVITDGFIAPALAEHCAPSSATCTSQTLVMLTFGAMQIEYLTRFAFVAVAIAVLGWSSALLSTPAAARWSGAAGMVAGVSAARGVDLVASAAHASHPPLCHGWSACLVSDCRDFDDHRAEAVWSGRKFPALNVSNRELSQRPLRLRVSDAGPARRLELAGGLASGSLPGRKPRSAGSRAGGGVRLWRLRRRAGGPRWADEADGDCRGVQDVLCAAHDAF